MIRRTYLLYLLLGAAFLAASVLYYLCPAWEYAYPGCWFRSATGLSCPTCGGQRAFSELLHGDIGAAFRYNALFVSALGAVPIILIWRKLFRPKPLTPRATLCLIISVLAVIVAFAVVRNVH